MTELPTADLETRCGYVAIVGRPNVGKSTLMNNILGQKISITAHKPQTTRHQILGIHSTPAGQIVFIDTPGIHSNTPRAINRYMNRVALAVLQDVDIVLWLLDAQQFSDEDQRIGETLSKSDKPLVVAINKIDLVEEKPKLLPLAEDIQRRFDPMALMMISARSGKGVGELEKRLSASLPFARPFYDESQITDRTERFLAAEFVREQVTRRLHQELPYATTVEIEAYDRDEKLVNIAAVIWVERAGQKGIVIGKSGATLKAIGKAARQQLETLLEQRVYLQLWVKVKSGWSDDDRALRSFGYAD